MTVLASAGASRRVCLAAGLLAATVLVACGSPPASIPPSTATPPPATNTPTPPTSEPAATDTPPEPPALATPEGAGEVAPEFVIQIGGSLEDLDSGDYLIVWDLTSLEEGKALYRIVTWDGARAESLFELETLSGGPDIPELVAFEPPFAWFEVLDPPGADGLLAADLNQGRLHQFAFGGAGECYSPTADFVGETYFGFECDLESGEDVWYAAALDLLRITGSTLLPGEVSMGGWLGPERVFFSEPDNPLAEDFEFCSAEAPGWELACVSLPFSVGNLRPDDALGWGWPGAEYEDDGLGGLLPVVFDLACLEAGAAACEPIPATSPGLPEDFTADLSSAAWTPDGRTLIVALADCFENETYIWRFDPDLSASDMLAVLQGCYSLPRGGAFWSQDGSRFSVETGDAGDPPLVISLEGDAPFRLPVVGRVVGSLYLP